jgi:mannan endo-1,4-beta-mannosidase
VVRDSTRLLLDGRPFSFAGANAYHLFMDAARGDTDAVLGIFASARGAGLTVIRTWAFNDSPDSLNPAVIQYRPGAFNESALRGLDYIVARAPEFNLRLLFTLVNNWDDYGGMNRYVAWRAGLPGAQAAKHAAPYSAVEQARTVTGAAGRAYRVALDSSWGHDDFYTDTVIGAWYRNYLDQITGRMNILTGVRFRDDPAILGWELANEPRSSDPSGGIVRDWIGSASGYLKTIDTNHLVGTGEEGFDVAPGIYSTSQYAGQEWLFDGTGGVSFSMNTGLPSVDFGSIHLYPDYWNFPAGAGSGWITDHVRVGGVSGKPLLLGEFGSIVDKAVVYSSWLNTAVADDAAGALVWQLVRPGEIDLQGFGIACPVDSAVCAALAEAASNFVRRDSGGPGLPSSFRLGQNYPNPFNAMTLIPYTLPEDARVVIDLWDMTGRKVLTLFEGFQGRGERVQLFDAGGLATGAYVYRISTPGFTDDRKMLIVR